MGIFDFFKGNNKQKYPTWFDGYKFKEGLTVKNYNTSESIKLNNVELSIYRLTRELQNDFRKTNFFMGGSSEFTEKVDKGIQWFKENNLEAYNILFKPKTQNDVNEEIETPSNEPSTDLEEIIKLSEELSENKKSKKDKKDILSDNVKKHYYESGELESIINFVDGVRQGESKYYFKDGKLETIENYVNGLKQGEEKWYFDGSVEGELRYTDNYVAGLKQGERKVYYGSGELNYTINYVDGLTQGESKSYYKSGELQKIENYVDDVNQGEEKWYYESGELKSITNYLDSIPQGEEKEYYESGKLKLKTTWANNYMQEEKWYNESGEIEKTVNYDYVRFPLDGVKR